MQVYYKFMNVHWMVAGNQDVIDAMDRLLADYFVRESENEEIDFRVFLENKSYDELREMLEFGQRIVIHNSKKSAVHEAGTEYRNGLTTSIYNHATKSVYRLNYLSKEIHIYNSDKGVLHKDGIRVVRDIVKVLAEEKSRAVMLHAAALYKKEYGGIILVGGKGCGKTSVSLELLYKYGFSEVSRDRIMLKKENSKYMIYGWPNYYNLTIRTMNKYDNTRQLIPKEYLSLSIDEMENVNRKMQFTAKEMRIDHKAATAELKHVFYLNNNAKGICLSKQELLAISCYTPDDLNYPDWHHWGDSSRKEAITFAENLQQEIDSTVIDWNSPEEAAEDIKRSFLK